MEGHKQLESHFLKIRTIFPKNFDGKTGEPVSQMSPATSPPPAEQLDLKVLRAAYAVTDIHCMGEILNDIEVLYLRYWFPDFRFGHSLDGIQKHKKDMYPGRALW